MPIHDKLFPVVQRSTAWDTYDLGDNLHIEPKHEINP